MNYIVFVYTMNELYRFYIHNDVQEGTNIQFDNSVTNTLLILIMGCASLILYKVLLKIIDTKRK